MFDINKLKNYIWDEKLINEYHINIIHFERNQFVKRNLLKPFKTSLNHYSFCFMWISCPVLKPHIYKFNLLLHAIKIRYNDKEIISFMHKLMKLKNDIAYSFTLVLLQNVNDFYSWLFTIEKIHLNDTKIRRIRIGFRYYINMFRNHFIIRNKINLIKNYIFVPIWLWRVIN